LESRISLSADALIATSILTVSVTCSRTCHDLITGELVSDIPDLINRCVTTRITGELVSATPELVNRCVMSDSITGELVSVSVTLELVSRCVMTQSQVSSLVPHLSSSLTGVSRLSHR